MFIVFFLLGMFFFLFPKYLQFKGTNYQKASGNTFLRTLFNTGNYGEYLTFSKLEKLPGHYRLMTNLYLPKKDGSTTEVDLIMLHETGLYVFESKNFSGWIFGDEKNKHWMQTFPNKRKEKFFNPIWQNKAHINALKTVLGTEYDRFFKSYIIFSERCTLKKINVTSSNEKVMKRNNLITTIKKEISNSEKLLTRQDMDQLFFKLNKYTHADSSVKDAHVRQIQLKK
ncbi:nuclease-related domain-containing protein [Neobacillus sp. WH10]|uniref:nuclease-related domain-containing protein n=1 Tax=Neobacillus sp. WH10 TaxID=3047873 RepID=UPI0024C0F3C9|nr:nuclease-related domain-containing protein [Neobacillus sp. WH10]WHY79931.1 nuclease-related domain-containing protein [Neobacillus sp. WH10]